MKEQVMSKEKVKREKEKKEFDKKHAEALEAAKNEANQKMAIGAVVGTILTFVMAFLLFGGSGQKIPA